MKPSEKAQYPHYPGVEYKLQPEAHCNTRYFGTQSKHQIGETEREVCEVKWWTGAAHT